jgi:hypothetical protein
MFNSIISYTNKAINMGVSAAAQIDHDLNIALKGLTVMSMGIIGLRNSKIFASEKEKKTYNNSFLGKKKLAVLSSCYVFLGAFLIAGAAYNFFNRNNACIYYRDHKLCKNNLCYPRKEMPQFDDKTLEEFKQLRPYKYTTFNASDLISTQNEADTYKIQSMIESSNRGEWDPCTAKKIVTYGPTSKPFILDGHHRAFSCKLMNRTVDAVHFPGYHPRIFDLANNMPGIYHQDSGEFEAS